MNLFKKIKFNYHLKLIENYIDTEEFSLASAELSKLKKDNFAIFIEILKALDNKLCDISNASIYNQKIIWTLSYEPYNLDYINHFISFYLSKSLNTNYLFESFTEALAQSLSTIKFKQNEIKFNDMVQFSGLYQNILLFDPGLDLRLLNSSSAFFESNNSKYFIYPNSTLCYFYVIRDPSEIFLNQKNKLGSSEAAYEELLNNRNQLYLNQPSSIQSFKIYENRVNYNINTKSWTDPNVISTYRGKIILYDNLVNKTQDTLVDIIYHLKRYYPSLKIDLHEIQKFIDQNKIINEVKGYISNTEGKFLSKNIIKNNYLN